MSESVLLRDETKNITGNMAAINTPQNKRIFLYGRLFLGGTTAGLVGIASIVPPKIPYILSQCKPFGCRKRGNYYMTYFGANYPILVSREIPSLCQKISKLLRDFDEELQK